MKLKTDITIKDGQWTQKCGPSHHTAARHLIILSSQLSIKMCPLFFLLSLESLMDERREFNVTLHRQVPFGIDMGTNTAMR